MKYFGRERKISKENIFSRGRVFTFTRMVLHSSHEIQRLRIIGQLFCYEDADTFHSTRMRMLQFVSVALLYNTMYMTYMCLRVTRITMLPLSNWSLLVLACNIFGDKYDAKGIANNFLAARESIRILVENFYRYVLSRTVRNIWKLGRTRATHIQSQKWIYVLKARNWFGSIYVKRSCIERSWKKNCDCKILNRDPILRTLCSFYATLRKKWIFHVKKIISQFYRRFCRVLLYKYLILHLLVAEALRRGHAVFYGIFFPLWRGEAKVRHYVGATKG